MGTDRWVLFDLDGTLLDYHAAEAAAVATTLADGGLPVTEEVIGDYRRINARLWEALERGETTGDRLRVQRWEELAARHSGRSVDAGELARRYIRALGTGTQLLPGAPEVVASVAETHRIAFITNGLSDVQRPRLAGSSLADAAEVLIISDEVGAAKPDAAIFEVAFAQMGAPPRANVTMVGDSLTADIAGAAGFGLPSVWLASEGAPPPDGDGPQPTHVIRALWELPQLLAGGSGAVADGQPPRAAG